MQHVFGTLLSLLSGLTKVVKLGAGFRDGCIKGKSIDSYNGLCAFCRVLVILLRCSTPFSAEEVWGEAKGSKSTWGMGVGVEGVLKTFLDVSLHTCVTLLACLLVHSHLL